MGIGEGEARRRLRKLRPDGGGAGARVICCMAGAKSLKLPERLRWGSPQVVRAVPRNLAGRQDDRLTVTVQAGSMAFQIRRAGLFARSLPSGPLLDPFATQLSNLDGDEADEHSDTLPRVRSDTILVATRRVWLIRVT